MEGILQIEQFVVTLVERVGAYHGDLVWEGHRGGLAGKVVEVGAEGVLNVVGELVVLVCERGGEAGGAV